jgi:hypothetical protein
MTKAFRLTEEDSGRYVQGKNDKRRFSNKTTVLSLPGLVRDHTGTFQGQEEPSPDLLSPQGLPKWRDRSAIPAETFTV